MTTEIAVLNRLGVALATDSAVTITGGGRTKIFNSADKLFELSCKHPIALMVNGNMDCFGIPWEILIKDFRSVHGDKNRQHVSTWAEDFLSYVSERVDGSSQYAESYFNDVVDYELNVIKNGIAEIFWSKTSDKQIHPQKIADDNALKISQKRIEYLDKIGIAASLKDVTLERVLEVYKSKLDILFKNAFSPLSIDSIVLDSIKVQVAKALVSLQQTNYFTGLIIAGYGNDDIFPSISTADVDGIILDQLKFSSITEAASIKTKDLGHVISFAQTDVIERLLAGVDPRYVNEMAAFIEETVSKAAEGIIKVDSRKRVSINEKKARSEAAVAIARAAVDDYFETSQKLKEEFKQEFEKMIAMMPKLELIELAEALVSITAIERKATSDEGTVGGPIDVAFITKHEGFVWIKRKLYFGPNLNPRYFWRKFNVGTRESQ